MIEQWKEVLTSQMRRRLGGVPATRGTWSSNKRSGHATGGYLSAKRLECKPGSFAVMHRHIHMNIAMSRSKITPRPMGRPPTRLIAE
jgi:hypothetical protein